MTLGTNILLSRIAAGDNEAFKTLFEMFYPKVKIFLVKFLKDEVVAQDISQEIFVKIWTYREALPDIRSFNSYIYRMTRNAALNHIRGNRQTMDILQTSILDDKDIESDYQTKEKELLIRLTVEHMPPQRQRIFKMSREQGLSNDDIAIKLGVTKKTVENNITMALKELRDVILAFLVFFLS
jgi:RNA polymerase sigma-70 factor (ECF subfamily)